MTKLTFSLNDSEHNAKLTLFTTLINMILMFQSRFKPFQTVTFGYMCYNLVQLGAHQGLLTKENLQKLFYTGILLRHIYNECSTKKKMIGIGLLYIMIQTFTTNDNLVRLYIGEHLGTLTDEEIINKNMISVMSSFNELSKKISSIGTLSELDTFSSSLLNFKNSYQEHLRELLGYYNCFGFTEKKTILRLLSNETKDNILKEFQEEDDTQLINLISEKSKKHLDKYSDPDIVNGVVKQLFILQNAFDSLNKLNDLIDDLKCSCTDQPSNGLKAIKVDVENNVGVNIPYLFYMIYFKLPIQQNHEIISSHSNSSKFKTFFEDSDREKGFVDYIDTQFQSLMNSKKYSQHKGMFLSLNKAVNPFLNPSSELHKRIVDFFYKELNRECQGLYHCEKNEK